MVTDGAQVIAGALGGHTLLAALTLLLHLPHTPLTGEGGAGLGVAVGLPLVTQAGGAEVLLPLFTMLELLPCHQTRVGHTLRTARPRIDHKVLPRLADDGLAFGSGALDLASVAQTLGAGRGPPLLAIPVLLSV